MAGAAARAVTGSAVPALLVALLVACAVAARVAVVGGASACDGVNCGMGTCAELPAPIPAFPGLPTVAYKCVCDPGWNSPWIPSLPCIFPTCSTSESCFNITLKPPTITNITNLNICGIIDLCGPDGTCVAGKSFLDFECQCNPGFANLFGSISPCIRSCVIGKDGCQLLPPPTSPPPPPTSPAPPPGNPDSSGPTPPPSSTEGSVSSLHNLVMLLLLLTTAAVDMA